MKDFNRPMNVIAQVIANLQMAIASVDRINEILALPEEENGTIKEFTFNNSIEFKNVTFGYVEGKKVLNNFNLKINKGEKIALVGKTGAGKTTIVNLLMNFHKHYDGQILIDGKEFTFGERATSGTKKKWDEFLESQSESISSLFTHELIRFLP